MHYGNQSALAEMGEWYNPWTWDLGLTAPVVDPKRYPKFMTVSPIDLSASGPTSQYLTPQAVDQTMIDAVNMPLSKNKPIDYGDEAPRASAPPKPRTQLLYGPDNALFKAAGVGVSTGLKPSSDTEETAKESFYRRVASGEISETYTGPAGEVYRGPSGSDPAPTVKKGAFPWWLLPVGAAAGAGGVIAAQKIRGKKKVGPKVQMYPQQQPSGMVSPVVMLGGFLVIGLLGYAAYSASKK